MRHGHSSLNIQAGPLSLKQECLLVLLLPKVHTWWAPSSGESPSVPGSRHKYSLGREFQVPAAQSMVLEQERGTVSKWIYPTCPR